MSCAVVMPQDGVACTERAIRNVADPFWRATGAHGFMHLTCGIRGIKETCAMRYWNALPRRSAQMKQ